MDSPIIYWCRQDLRVEDNPALKAALSRPGGVLPVYIYTQSTPMGAASRWWLHYALEDFQHTLAQKGLSLVFKQGDALAVLQHLIQETGSSCVVWNRCYEPKQAQEDAQIKKILAQSDVEVCTFNSHLLHEPAAVRNQSGKPFQVFTAFWKHCQKMPSSQPVAMPPTPWKNYPKPVASQTLSDFNLLPAINWAEGFSAYGLPTEHAAHQALHNFAKHQLQDYPTSRDIPGVQGTSQLSAYLHFGQISPRQVVQVIQNSAADAKAKEKYIAEIGWREFGYHLLWHFPHTPTQPLVPAFEHFGWARNDEWIAAWQKGQTGIPIVDAGMRQLWQTGWMHNRVRMIVASYLVKHLLQPWLAGAEWFWDTLVDADLASNTLGWQWSAGCGADAAPYFRVFNPILQGDKFDPQGAYVKRYVPELKDVPRAYIHKPWEAPHALLAQCGVILGHHYPFPIVRPDEGRARALQAYEAFRQQY